MMTNHSPRLWSTLPWIALCLLAAAWLFSQAFSPTQTEQSSDESHELMALKQIADHVRSIDQRLKHLDENQRVPAPERATLEILPENDSATASLTHVVSQLAGAVDRLMSPPAQSSTKSLSEIRNSYPGKNQAKVDELLNQRNEVTRREIGTMTVEELLSAVGNPDDIQGGGELYKWIYDRSQRTERPRELHVYIHPTSRTVASVATSRY